MYQKTKPLLNVFYADMDEGGNDDGDAMLLLLAPSLSIGILLLHCDYYLLLSFFTCLCCGKVFDCVHA